MGVDQHPVAAERPFRFRTADLDTARAQVTKTFAEHEMTIRGGRGLDCRLDLAPSTRLTLGLLSYGADVTITGPPMRTNYHLNLPITGTSTVEQNGQRRASVAGQTGIALVPNSPLSIHWEPDGIQYAVKLPKELLEAHAAKLAGQPIGEIRFTLEFDLTTGAAQSLLSTTAFLYAELSRPGGLATMPAARQELESALMTQALMAVPSRLTGLLESSPVHTRRSRIREVMEFVDAHPDRELSTAELAAAAGIGVRALQAGFHDVVGMSPRSYVRGVRLDRVHAALSTGGQGTVTQVAARWGFHHPGHFAQQYRERFGVLPSDTAQPGRG